jgi:hypothetical protein
VPNFRNNHDQRRRRESRRWAMLNALRAASTNDDPADAVRTADTVQRHPKTLRLTADDFKVAPRGRA